MSKLKRPSRYAAPGVAMSVVALLVGASPAGAQEVVLGEIIVTAQKRLEDVRDVPAAVSVFSGEELDNLHATQLTDFAPYVVGLQVTSQGAPGLTSITLRGIAPISGGATVGTYIDETPLGSSGLYQRATIFALDLLPYDIARVEVLRGPHGTLYGAGAMGGLLKYVARDPDLSEFEFRVGGGVSDAEGAGDAGSDLRFGANLPLVEDRLAVRASYARNEIAGFIDNDTDGREDINDGTQETARLALLWQPSEAVGLRLTAMRQSIDSDNNGIAALDPVTFQPITADLAGRVFVDEPFKKDIDFYAATLNWDLGWASFTSATGYSDVVTDQRQDTTILFGEFPLLFGLPPGISFFDLDLDLQKFTQEFRLTSKTTGRFEWQVGAFYTWEDADNSQFIRLQDQGGTPIPGLDPLGVVALPSEYDELAVFGNGTFKFTERFKLGAGVRFARDDQEFSQIVTGGLLLPIGTTSGTSEEDIFTWSFTPQFQLTDDAMLYARIASGYQPGGPNLALPGVPPTVDASALTSYEIGLKSEFADRRVLLDLIAFYIDWEDIQIGDAIGAVSFFINGGEAVSQGLELSTAFLLGEGWQLGLNAAYTDATVSNDVPSLGGLAGDQLPLVPELAGSATVDYDFPLGGDWHGHVGAGYRWVDDRKTGLDSDPGALTLDSYGAIDLNADLSNDHWTIRVYARNLDDERAYLVMGAVGSAVTGVIDHVSAVPIQPRTYGVELDFRF